MMGIKEQATKNSAASQQAACTPSGCKACQRKGVAIYPLRVAAVPKLVVKAGWQPAVPDQGVALAGGNFKYALRTLRAGYVYVLLDDKVWQGYQVTEAGFLRQFNPYDMPQAEKVAPLSQACLTQNHDISASFINIEAPYKKAAIAFSNDAWSKTVLNEYKSGKRPASRFTHLTLSGNKVTIAGAGRSLTLDPTLTTLQSHVVEFAAGFLPNIVAKESGTGGAHGFYPRGDKSKQAALGSKIAQLSQQYKAPVNAIVLDDAVGIVQELNYARLDVVEAVASYRSKPENLHQSTISDAILSIQAVMNKQIDADKGITAMTLPTFTEFPSLDASEYTISREDMVKSAKKSAMKRMQQYYNEPARAAFASKYHLTLDSYMRTMQSVGKDLEAWYRAALWLTVIEQDYSPVTSVLSWAAQLGMLASSLQGGMAGLDKATSVWKSWLETPKSPPYLALLGTQAGLINAVYQGSATYSNLKSVLNTQDVCDYVDSLKFNVEVGGLTMSMNGAFSLVGDTLSEKARRGFERSMQALAYVAEGGPAVTIFSGEITVREYQSILRSQLDGHGRPVWNTLREGPKASTSTAQMGNWLQVTDPKTLGQKIHVRFATLLKDIDSPAFKQAARKAGTSVNALKNGSLLKDGSRLAHFPDLVLASDAVDKSLTTGQLNMSLGESLRIARQQYQLPRRVLSSSGLGFVLGAVMLGLQKSAMDDNLKALQQTVAGDTQAQMKLTSSALMVTASAVEMVGFGHMVARWGTAPWVKAGQKIEVFGQLVSYAHPLIRVAGVIGGVASLVDGIGMFMKGRDASKQGDSTAASRYYWAATFTIASGGAGIVAGVTANFALLGPIGICIGLAILGAVLATMAAEAVRSPLEVWLSDTCFGIHGARGKHDKVWNANSLADLQAAMKAYYTIVSGVSVQIQRQWGTEIMLNSVGTRLAAVRVVLPGCSKTGSDWLVELTAKGKAGSQLLTHTASPAKQTGLATQAKQTFTSMVPMGEGMSVPTTLSTDATLKPTWDSNGLVLQGEFVLDLARFSNAQLTVTYWPDKTQPNDSLQLTANSEN